MSRPPTTVLHQRWRLSEHLINMQYAWASCIIIHLRQSTSVMFSLSQVTDHWPVCHLVYSLWNKLTHCQISTQCYFHLATYSPVDINMLWVWWQLFYNVKESIHQLHNDYNSPVIPTLTTMCVCVKLVDWLRAFLISGLFVCVVPLPPEQLGQWRETLI